MSDESGRGQRAASVGSAVRAGAHAHRRTVEALFRHPTPQNLEWMDVVALFESIGTVRRRANGKLVFELAGERLVIQKAHEKELSSLEVVSLRQFLERAGWSPQAAYPEAARRDVEPATLMVVVDHHGARIYRIVPGSGEPSPHEIAPYDPHHFMHHLTHKDQSRQEGQRAPDDPSFYRRIGDALAPAGNIIIVGHGKGRSSAARRLVEYLQTHHRETYARVVSEIDADLSAMTMPQLLRLAEQAL